MNGPRRANLLLMCDTERAIFDAIQSVENMGADPLLTDAVVLLQQARDKVGDFVDSQS